MTVLDRIPLDRINTGARGIRFSRALLTIIAAVFYGFGWVSHKALGGTLYGIGWAAAKVFGAAWAAISWTALAVKVGWVDARSGGARGPA